jgi:hypothetical protein
LLAGRPAARWLNGLRVLLAALALALLSGCATAPPTTVQRLDADAQAQLVAARSLRLPAEMRAAHYLRAAELTAPLVDTAPEAADATRIYNAAVAELTILLRAAEKGQLWSHPLTVAGGGRSYQLKFQPADKPGLWSPDYFTEFRDASTVAERKVVKTSYRRAGVGGVLVGVRKMDPREEFAPKRGIVAAVTATLNFNGPQALLTLNDPTKLETVRLAGEKRPLAADFSAPLCVYPRVNLFWTGLFEALRPGKFAQDTGIFQLQPYDPQRIPVIYVHGLISTPFIWLDPINQINEDPVLRSRFQPMVFAYPSGYPAAYSALQFREALAKLQQRYPMPHGFILIAHSEGGLLSQMQTTTLTRADWDRAIGTKAEDFFHRVKPGSVLERSILFTANPAAKRVIFIATPHRGSDMAIQSIGELATRLIRLPVTLVGTMQDTLGSTVSFITGSAKVIPTSVTSLSPKNPTLITMATKQVVPPCHSIIGNRGKPGPLAESSDGVVPYWSSHLDYAKSEVIVPGPHGCYDYPGAVAEMKRVLHLHLQAGSR